LEKLDNLDPATVTTNTTDYFIEFDKSVNKAVESTDSWTYGSIMVNEIGTDTANVNGWRLGDTY
jgi:hypothetical protein